MTTLRTPRRPRRPLVAFADRVGARELKAQLSAYLERLARGESFVVTDYGRPVARLLPYRSDPVVDELISTGRATWSGRTVRIPTRPVALADGRSLFER